MAMARPISPVGSKHDSPSVLRERALAQALDDHMNEVADEAERHVGIQEAIGRLENRIAALKLWNTQDEDGRAKQAEALRKEDEVRALKAQAERVVLGILQHTLDIEEKGILVPIEGQPPSLIEVPAGCAFRPRCPYAKDVCLSKVPQPVAIDGRYATCHFAGDDSFVEKRIRGAV